MTRRLLIPVATLAALLASLAVAAPGASAASPHCSSTFSVLHNDRIGALRVPAGEYDITLIRQNRITCARASQLFSRFLQDFDGTLPTRVAPERAQGEVRQHPPRVRLLGRAQQLRRRRRRAASGR